MTAFRQVLGIIVLLQCTRIFVGPQTTVKTTISFEAYLKAKRAKRFHYEYFPNYGYEPYWADGEWILSTTKQSVTEKGSSTTKLPRVCGEECSYLLRRIKKVCARMSNDSRYYWEGCGTASSSWMAALNCVGKPQDDFQQGYFTFNSYCDFLNSQCHSKFYNTSRWVLLHVGPCLKLDRYFKPIWHSALPISRADYFLELFANNT